MWNHWRTILEEWKDLTIPRWYFATSSFSDDDVNAEYELHAFSDASNEAYGCVVYLRKQTQTEVCTSFVFEKSRAVLKPAELANCQKRIVCCHHICRPDVSSSESTSNAPLPEVFLVRFKSCDAVNLEPRSSPRPIYISTN